jgi:predicted nucleotidyltransferase
MDSTVEERLHAEAMRHPYPLVFATLSGAHLYGFASPDSDYDLRAVHVLPAHEVVGLEPRRETVAVAATYDGLELDLVSHDIKKFFTLLLRRNGYVLEQLYSPLVVHTTPDHVELKVIARGCLTRHHVYHYRGFAEHEWKVFSQEEPARVKPLLYVYRVLLTGIHLLRTGKVEANLAQLNTSFNLSYLDELIALKRGGSERSVLPTADHAFHEREYARLRGELEEAATRSQLPEAPTAAPALNDLLVRIRLSSAQALKGGPEG